MTPARPDANQPPWHQTILDFSADWIWEIDLQGRHLYSNPAVREILGYTPEEISGQSAFDLVHEADRDWIQKELPCHLRQKTGWRNWVLRWKHRACFQIPRRRDAAHSGCTARKSPQGDVVASFTGSDNAGRSNGRVPKGWGNLANAQSSRTARLASAACQSQVWRRHSASGALKVEPATSLRRLP